MEKTPSMAARLRQRRLCLEMIRHLLMTYLFGDETEEEKKVAEGTPRSPKRKNWFQLVTVSRSSRSSTKLE